MLTGITVCESQELSHRLSRALASTEKISIKRKVIEYPGAAELLRMLRTQTPDVLFLSFESVEKAHELMHALESEGSRVHVVGISSQLDVQLLQDMMRAGVRECLSEPFERHSLLEMLGRVKTKPNTQAALIPRVISFLPSKAGVGASTVALNVSAALARQPETRVLLSDLDLSTGMLDFMLKLGNENSVMDALERAGELDEDLWSGLVSKVGGLHVLHAGHKQANPAIDGLQIRKLICAGAGIYEAMCFDLSGNMEPFSIDILRESKGIVLVCTPEASSLHLARKKLAVLRGLDLEDRVAVLVNRSSSGDILNQHQIQQLLRVPVRQMVPNNYPEVNRAIEGAQCIPADSKLGRVFEQFACQLLDRNAPSHPDDKKTKLFDFFSTARGPVSTKLT